MSIDLEVDKDGVATVTINRAEVHNALDAEHYAAISKAWQTVRDDPQIRCATRRGCSTTTGLSSPPMESCPATSSTPSPSPSPAPRS